jgi:hypothetical protein
VEHLDDLSPHDHKAGHDDYGVDDHYGVDHHHDRCDYDIGTAGGPLTDAEIVSIVAQNPGYPGDLREQLVNDPAHEQLCSGVGQGRSVAAVWLAGTATADGRPVLDWLLERRAHVDPLDG